MILKKTFPNNDLKKELFKKGPYKRFPKKDLAFLRKDSKTRLLRKEPQNRASQEKTLKCFPKSTSKKSFPRMHLKEEFS
ncbi:hypothetical protein BpHYR1_042773 [Brachionus plicatilis]|uniref:Uncharacterized protein n=1 Tax=Brachionus plicatilis TaxID=10195 RepID=A0A3M7RUZ8_BRAPC|nr:hypothetical protein BpHYR1_042773 [Brachionus plicatilis]